MCICESKKVAGLFRTTRLWVFSNQMDTIPLPSDTNIALLKGWRDKYGAIPQCLISMAAVMWGVDAGVLGAYLRLGLVLSVVVLRKWNK